MKYNTIAELEAYFRNEIGRLSQKEIEDARNEIQRIKSKNINQIEEYEAKNNKVYLEHEIKNIESEHAIAISKLIDENQRKLMRKRDELINVLFEDVKKKLIQYSETEDYLITMKDKIRKISSQFNSDAYLNLSERDMEKAEELKVLFSGNVTVKKNKDIRLGGFIIEFIHENIFVDETYDSKLKEQREKFYANSELILN